LTRKEEVMQFEVNIQEIHGFTYLVNANNYSEALTAGEQRYANGEFGDVESAAYATIHKIEVVQDGTVVYDSRKEIL
jgi:hypothetical protein